MTKFTSKVKMPEPVGYAVSYSSSGIIHASYISSDEAVSCGYPITLVCAKQAEAYANERVKEVLEHLKNASMNSPIEQDLVNDDGAKATAWHISAKIRALIHNYTE